MALTIVFRRRRSFFNLPQTPDVEAKLEQIARESGCRSDELVVGAVRCHIDGLAYVREMLDRRYDDLESGRVQPIDGEVFFESLRKREDELLKKSTP